VEKRGLFRWSGGGEKKKKGEKRVHKTGHVEPEIRQEKREGLGETTDARSRKGERVTTEGEEKNSLSFLTRGGDTFLKKKGKKGVPGKRKNGAGELVLLKKGGNVELVTQRKKGGGENVDQRGEAPKHEGNLLAKKKKKRNVPAREKTSGTSKKTAKIPAALQKERVNPEQQRPQTQKEKKGKGPFVGRGENGITISKKEKRDKDRQGPPTNEGKKKNGGCFRKREGGFWGRGGKARGTGKGGGFLAAFASRRGEKSPRLVEGCSLSLRDGRC